MTEASFQAARKVMASANYIRGKITVAKGEVGKWTKIESSYRDNLQEGKAEGAKKCLDNALTRLNEWRAKFEKLNFPDINLTATKKVLNQCENCGEPTEGTYCLICQS